MQNIFTPVSNPHAQVANSKLTLSKHTKRNSTKGPVRKAGVGFNKLGKPQVASSFLSEKAVALHLSFHWECAIISIISTWSPQSFETVVSVEIFYNAPSNAEVSNLQPTGCTPLRMAVNVAQHKIVNLFKTL